MESQSSIGEEGMNESEYQRNVSGGSTSRVNESTPTPNERSSTTSEDVSQGHATGENITPDTTTDDESPSTSRRLKRDREESGSLDDGSGSDYSEDDMDHWARRLNKRPKNAGNMKTLRQLAEKEILKIMEIDVDEPQAKALYCCGGSTPSSKPFSKIALRWDCPDEEDISRKIEFPVYEGKRAFQTNINKFMSAGDGGEAIATMDRTQFSIDIDPYSLGIIDVISKSLLPASQILSKEKIPTQYSLRAELSTLHVRGMGGHTLQLPLETTKTQNKNVGRLFLCLPSSHQGGELKVSHEGFSTIFDWSKSLAHPIEIKWAAFFRECEHSFQPVSKGYQVILNYNIYLENFSNLILTKTSSPMDATVFPLYERIRDVLERPFMKNGGVLGFHCQKSYNLPADIKELPHEFVGIDRVIYSVFKSLGMEVDLRPYLDLTPLDQMDEFEYEMYLEYREDGYDSDDSGAVCPGCGGDCCRPSFEEWRAKIPKFDAIGTEFQPLVMTNTGTEESFIREEKVDSLQQQWKFEKRKDINWLNTFSEADKSPQSLAIVNEQHYDDMESDVERYYSHAVILITIPKFLERNVRDVLFSALKDRSEE